MKAGLVFVDGDFVAADKAVLPVERLEHLAAVSLAESLPVEDGRPRHLAEHLVRLAEGCRVLGWPDPDRGLLAASLRELPRRNRLGQGSLRVRWWGGLARPLLLAQALPARPLPKDGIRLMTSVVRHYGPDSLNARAKVAHMLPNWLARAETQAWAEDGLRLTPDGLVAEGVWTNVVAVKRGVARTPPLHSGILEGVTRARLLAGLRRKGLVVREEPLARYDLWTADRLWVTSSLRGALSVAAVDGRQLPLGCKDFP